MTEILKEEVNEPPHPLIGHWTDVLTGPLMGTKVRVIKIVKDKAFVAARLFNNLTDVCLPVDHIDPGYVVTKDRRFIITDPKYKYIDDAMAQLAALDAYKLRVSPEHDMAILPNYFWFSGRENQEGIKYKARLPVFGVWRVLSVNVAILPTLFISRKLLHHANKTAPSIKEYKAMLDKKKFKDKLYWPNVYRGVNFDPFSFFKEDTSKRILQNELMDSFTKGDLIPLSIKFSSIPECGRDDLLMVPLVYHPRDVGDLLIAFEWGLFFEKVELDIAPSVAS